MIKCLISDLDGTLFLGHGKTVFDLTKRNQKALKMAKENGLVIAVASGRMLGYGERVLDIIGADTRLICGFNGAVCRFGDGPLDCIAMEKAMAKILLGEALKREDVEYMQIQTLDSIRIFDDPLSAIADKYRSQAEEFGIDSVSDLGIAAWLEVDSLSPIGKFSICLKTKEKTLDFMDELSEKYPELNITKSNDTLIEIMKDGADKGRFVRFIQEKTGFKKEEIAAIGDNSNDLAMIRASGIGFGIKSGDEKLLSEVKYTVEDVAQAIALILKERGVQYED